MIAFRPYFSDYDGTKRVATVCSNRGRERFPAHLDWPAASSRAVTIICEAGRLWLETPWLREEYTFPKWMQLAADRAAAMDALDTTIRNAR